MVLRSPRSWNDASQLLRSPVDDPRFGLDSLVSALNAIDQARALQEMQDAQRQTVQAQRDAMQDARKDQRRARTQASHVGGLAGGGGAPHGNLSGGGGGNGVIPRDVVVPDIIKRGNPNIDRAVNFNISQTNPHAAALAGDLRANGITVPTNAAESIAAAFRSSQQQMPTQESIRAIVQSMMPSGMARPSSGGSNPLADRIVNAVRAGTSAIRSNPMQQPSVMEAKPPERGFPGRGVMPGGGPPAGAATGTTPSTMPGRQQTPNGSRTPAGGPSAPIITYPGNRLDQQPAPVISYPGQQVGQSLPPTPDSIAAMARQRMASGNMTGLAQDVMSQVMQSVGQQRGVGGLPTADALVAAIRQQAQNGTTPANGQYRTITDPQTGQPRVVALPQAGAGPQPQTAPQGQYQTTNPAQQNIVADPNSRAGYTGGVGAPQGAIPTDLSIAYGRGADWSAVNQYDATFAAEGAKYGVDPAMLKAMAVIESGGQMIPNQNGSGAFGIMQIKPEIWGQQAAAMGYDLNTPEGQIGFAAAMLGGAVPGVAGSTPEERFVSTYYPTECLDCPGEDGHTPRQYLDDMSRLMGIINGAAPGGGMAPVPGQVGANAPAGSPAIPGSDVYIAGGGPIPGAMPTTSRNRPMDPSQTIPGHIDPNTGQFVPDDPTAMTTGGAAPPPNADPTINVAAPSGNPTGGVTGGQDIIDFAAQFEGLPYIWGAIPNPGDEIGGFDCSGYTRYVAHSLGYDNVPMGSEAQYQVAADQGILRDVSTAQPGDLIFWDTHFRGGGLCTNNVCPNNASHVGIYIGNGKAIQSGSGGVQVIDINAVYGVDQLPAEILGVASMGDYAPQSVYNL